jgi:16S rRNA (guanine527-N7)-methyltransferase
MSLVDVGTGAGFPGIPIKIVNKEMSVTLIDSLEKRIRFLDDVFKENSFEKIQLIHGRAEELSRRCAHRECYDMGIARAVASLSVLSEYILPFVRKGGFFISMKGSDIQKELSEAESAIYILGGKIKKVHSFMLPVENSKRNIILIEKVRQTPTEYPRKSGKPTKSPLR